MTAQRLNIAYQIHWETSWHVGSGYRTVAVDRLARQRKLASDSCQDATLRPFVPGAQVKGVLRHQSEKLAASLGADVVDPHDRGQGQREPLITNFQPLADSELMIDRLYGSRYQGECLFCSDATPVNEAPANELAARTRTGMDRATGTVKHQRLFTTQAASVESGVLAGRIRARHRPGVLTLNDDGIPYEYALLLAGLLSIDRLGGDKSAGRGGCRIELTKLVWNGEEKEPETFLQCFLEEDDWAEWVEMIRKENA